MNRSTLFAIAACALLACPHAHADVAPGALFADNAVLQQGRKIPVWGKAGDGEQVTVRMAGQEKRATAQNGRWRVELDPVKAGGPYEMTIAGANAITLKNLLVGEVWICGGQSNMQFELKDAAGAPEAIAASANPNLRCFTSPRWGAGEAERKLQNKWLAAAPETAGSFTAVGYFFGRELQKHLNVPVGLISTNYGGTNAEAWMSRDTLASEPQIASRFEAWMKAHNNTGGGAGGLYDGMLKPLAPYALRGVLWYQGENNASRAGDYERVLELLIHDWRTLWGQGDFPFLVVQLAPFGKLEGFTEIRAAQMAVAKKISNVATVVTTDVGDAADIHPKNKAPIGQRLALAARALAYGEPVEFRGPTLAEAKFNAGAATLTFDQVGQGLKSKGQAPKGFTLAGRDHKFVDADAKITAANTVVVSGPHVKAPVAVRFAWKDFNEADLWSGSNLPAEPFRAEDSPSTTN